MKINEMNEWNELIKKKWKWIKINEINENKWEWMKWNEINEKK